MIKAILFDLDGVLIDADHLHYQAFNDALLSQGLPIISAAEHVAMYKGLPTYRKLELLSERQRLDLSEAMRLAVAQRKQELTISTLRHTIHPDFEKISMLKKLRSRYAVAICSNSKRETIPEMLAASGLTDLVDFYLGNEDVQHAKPSPAIYLEAMRRLGVTPLECLIVEDSEIGRRAARDSGAFVCPVTDPSEVNYYRLEAALADAERVNVLIPAAGQGKRFLEAGFCYPKPLIQVHGTPMIELVLKNMAGVGRPVVLLQKSHCDQYCAAEAVINRAPTSVVVPVDGLTEGAACTALLARQWIDTNNELLIVNSDQYLECKVQSFVERMRAEGADGGILTFRASDPKWSYAATDANGLVTRVAEKEVISPHATVGVYYFRTGASFVKAAEAMIRKNIRVKGEFYVCPVFNELIGAGGRVRIHEIEGTLMHGLGTPEDLEAFLRKKESTQIIELGESTGGALPDDLRSNFTDVRVD